MMVNQKGAVHLLIPIIVLVAGTVFSSAYIPTTTNFSTSSQVLGEGKSNPRAAEQARGSSEKAPQQAKESSQKETEKKSESNKQIEKQSSLPAKMNLQSEDSISETEVDTEFEEDEDGVEIEASGSAQEGLEDLRSISKFPLRIDTTTNQLIMTKNGVERVLTVLPAKAVQNMLRAHLKKGLGPKFFGDATPSATPTSTPSATPSATPTVILDEPEATESAEITILTDQISIEEEDGQTVYKIPAKKHLKILGIIPVTTNFTGFVSADNGALIKEQESLLSKILDFLSP